MNMPLSRYILATFAWFSFLVGAGSALGAAPTVFSQAASNVTATSAQLNAHVNPQGLSTTVYYQYGLTTSYSLSTAQRNIGTTSGTYPAMAVGLTPGMTYHFRMVANSIGGTTYGADRTFTTPIQPPTATTQPASAISPTSAQLNSTVDPNGISTTISFQYGLTTAYGGTTPSANIGVSAGAYGIAASGLAPNTTYHYRVVATSAGGTTYGSDMTFTTPIPAPGATTQPASSVSSASAQLNGTVNPNGFSTTVYFQYGPTTAYGNNTASANVGVSAGGQSATITGLLPNRTYHYRIVAMNAGGTTYGGDATFTTPGQAPMAATLPASAITAGSAQLNGSANPNGTSTTFYFQYGLSTDYGNTTDAVNIGLAAGNYGTTASGLLPDTTYHYRIVVTNSAGTSYGSDMTFKTIVDPPTVTTRPASSITRTSAQMNCAVDPNGVSTTFYFQYGLTTAYTNSTSPANIGLTAGNYGAAVAGLQPNVTYYYRVVATSAGGTSYGVDSTFTTLADPPIVTTQPALAITPTSAQLNGIIDPQGLATAAYFEYGTTTSYGASVQATNSIATAQSIALNVPGLAPNTIYHYRLVASNRQHVVHGLDTSFTTSPAPQPAWVAGTAGVGLRLRSSPSLQAPVILILPEGSRVILIGEPEVIGDITWRQLSYGTNNGWAEQRHLTFIPGAEPAPPSAPINLRQWLADGVTPLAPGGTSAVPAVVLSAVPSGSNAQQFTVQFEIRPAGTSFSAPTISAAAGQGGAEAAVTVAPLANQAYHWRARSLDSNGVPSVWVTSSTNATNFHVRASRTPIATFSMDPSRVFAGQSVTLVADAAAEAGRTFAWNIGGTQASGPTNVYLFSQPGDIAVSLIVRDNTGVESQHLRTITVLGRSLAERINSAADQSKALLDEIKATAELAAAASTDWSESLPGSTSRIELQAALTALSILMDLRSSGIDPARTCNEWAEALYDGSALVRLQEKLGSSTSGEAVRAAFVDWALKEAETDSLGTAQRWLQGLVALVAQKKSEIEDLRQQALAAAGSLTPEQSDLLAANLQDRLNGAKAMAERYAAYAAVPLRFHELKAQDEPAWNSLNLGQQVFAVSAGVNTRLLGVMAGPVGPVVANVTAAELDLFGVLAVQSAEMQLLSASMHALGHGTTLANLITANINAGLLEVISQAPLASPGGQLCSVNQQSLGALRPCGFLSRWFSAGAWSDVTIQNTGQQSAVYRVEAFLTRNLHRGAPLDAVVAQDEIALSPGAQATVQLTYLSALGGQSPHSQDIRYVLSARTTNGWYRVDSQVKHFGTTYRDENGAVVDPALVVPAAVAQSPISSSLLVFPGSNTCQLNIIARNPLETPVMLSVSQDLPEGAAVLNTGDALRDGNRLTWDLDLQPGAMRWLQVTLSLTLPLSAPPVPQTTASLYDPINTAWVPFSATPALAYTYSAPSPRIYLHSMGTSGIDLNLSTLIPGIFHVDATTDFLHWESVLTITNAAGTLQVTDPGAATRPIRFYRARRQ